MRLLISHSCVTAMLFVIVGLSACTGRGETSEAWQRYCKPDSRDVAKSWARPENELVAAAVRRLSELPASAAAIVPRELRSFYGLHGAPATQFVDALCSEYRDSVDLLRAKLELLKRIAVVPAQQRQPYRPDREPWSQLTSGGYLNLVVISRSLQTFGAAGGTAAGRRSSVLLNACEFRFVLKSYLAQNRALLTEEDFREYVTERDDFLSTARENNECSADELDSFYAFRGAPYVSPRDPEAAVMRQVGSALVGHCPKVIPLRHWWSSPPISCPQFYSAPHRTRAAIARQMLGRLLVADERERQVMRSRWAPMFLSEDLDGDGRSELVLPRANAGAAHESSEGWARRLYHSFMSAPSAHAKPDAERTKAEEEIRRAFHGEEAGMLELVKAPTLPGSSTPDPALGAAHDFSERLAEILNRHAFYYSMFLYLDTFAELFPSTTIFLSASSRLADAQKFSLRGFATGKLRKPKLGWLYVFKIDSKHRVSADVSLQKSAVNFDRDWFDEPTFTGSAVYDEGGLDRFIEPDPAELHALLFLGEFELPSEILALLESSEAASTMSIAENRK